MELRTWKNKIKDEDLLKVLKTLSHENKNLYNKALFIQKQLFIKKKSLLSYGKLDKKLKSSKEYKALPAQTAQQTLDEVCKNIKSFFALLKLYNKKDKKVKDRPNFPGYKDIGDNHGFSTITYTNQQFKFVTVGTKMYIRLPIPAHLKQPDRPFLMVPINKKIWDMRKLVREIQLVPDRRGNSFRLHMTYDISNKKVVFKGKSKKVNTKDTKIKEKLKTIFIDLGLKRFITLVDLLNNKTFKFDAKLIQQINDLFNKKRALDQQRRELHFQKSEDEKYRKLIKKLERKLKQATKVQNKKDMYKLHRAIKLKKLEWNDRKFGDSKKMRRDIEKRNDQIEYLFHKLAKTLVSYCLTHGIKNIVIGYNEGWKQKVKMGKKTNQKFVQIPYAKFIEYLTDKAKLVDIHVELVNEAYTSKCDALALEDFPLEYNSSFKRHKKVGLNLGRRQGDLYKSSTGKVIHSDVNGALNIGRKWAKLHKLNLDSYFKRKFKSTKFLGCVKHPVELSSQSVQTYQLV